MFELVDIENALSLSDYEDHLHLEQTVRELRHDTHGIIRRLGATKVWMINSTPKGGGVAEMMPKLVSLLRDLGLDAQWAIVGASHERFYNVTKRVHNMLHGEPGRAFDGEDRAIYEAASREAAAALAHHVAPGDLVIVHDPQPLGAGSILAREMDVRTIWRCHIGLDMENAATRAAWDFLKPWTTTYERTVFSFAEYVPPFLADRAEVISPAIDPLSEKNCELTVRQVTDVLSSARMDGVFEPVLSPPYEHPAMRVQPDGSFAPADTPTSIGLMHRPIITQISRWDRLKGWQPLLKGFAHLKHCGHRTTMSDLHQRRLEHTRLVMAGPDPHAVQDDPEGLDVFNELCAAWRELPAAIRDDVVLLMLPMSSRPHNELMVNSLQRCSSVVAQNSLKEGFGLTVTEGMWKQRPILGTHAVGIRNQVRDGLDGCLLDDPESGEEIAETLDDMLAQPERCDAWGRSGQRRVSEQFLIFTQLRRWLSVIDDVASAGATGGDRRQA